MELIRRLRSELKVNTTCGASNITFGLPNRHGLNPAFISMAMGAGLTSAITNPLDLLSPGKVLFAHSLELAKNRGRIEQNPIFTTQIV